MSIKTAPGREAAPQAAPNFDRLAQVYRWMEAISFGPYLWRCRTAFLPDLHSAARALIFGDGDGRFTAELLRANVQVRVDAVDISRAMLRELVRRAGSSAGRVRTFAADARTWSYDSVPGTQSYDLVVTHFFLDCLAPSEIECLARRIRPVLQPGARWIISEFAVPQGVYGRWIAKPLVAFLYFVFRLLTGLGIQSLPDHADALERAGFRLQRRRLLLGGLLAAEEWVLQEGTNP